MSLRRQFVPLLLIERGGDLHQIDIDGCGRPAEPFVQVPIQHRHAPQHQKEDRQHTERQRAADQLGFDVRAGTVGLPLDVQLHHGAEQHEAERDRKNEDQRRNGPKQVGLLDGGGRGSESAQVEGALRDDQRSQDAEQHHRRPEHHSSFA